MTSRKSFIKVALDISLYSKIFFVLYYLYESYYALSVYVFTSLLLTITLLYFHKLNKNSCSIPIITLVDFFLVPLVYTVAFGKLINPLIFYVSYFPLIFLMIDIRKKWLLMTMFVCNMCLGLFSDVLSHYYLDGFSLYQFTDRQFLFVRNNLFLIIGGGLSYNLYLLLKKNRKTEHQLQVTLHELKKAYDTKTEFLSIMSHEIRTPLNGIIGLSDIISKDNDNEENIQVLRSSAKRLLILVNDILDFSKLESGKILFKEEVFNLRKEIKSIEHSLAYRSRQKGIKFLVQIEETVPYYFLGDINRLSQVLINLLDNALKFTSEGHVILKIECLKNEGGIANLKFIIEDTGVGIPVEQQNLIFEKFTQADNNSTRKFGGTGLGLSIARKIIELQGGEIQLKSQISKGSVFCFEISYPVSTPIEDSLLDSGLELHEDFSKVKILLVEDNEMNQFVFKQMFRSYNLQYEICSSGEEAIQLTKNQFFPIILMDYHMPDMNGIEAIKSIKSDSFNLNANSCFHLLTADVLTSFQEEKAELNIVSILRKPINRKTLMHCLNECIKARKNITQN